MKRVLFVGALVIFILGFASSIALSSYFYFENPKQIDFGSIESSLDSITIGKKDAVIEQVSPYNWIKEENIHVYEDKIMIDLPNARWAKFTDTNSMDPVLDAESNALEVIPTSIDQIHLGDIVSYKSNLVDSTIIHRVTKISEDSDGWYATFKGDNNPNEDPERVRFSQIQRVVVAIIY